jgi:multidrug efflux pump subunit AcrB
VPAAAQAVARAKRGFFRLFNWGFDKLTNGYAAGVRQTIRFGLVSVLLFGGMVAVTAGLFKTVPGAFIPDEDQGYFFLLTKLPDGASADRATKVVQRVEAYLDTDAAKQYTVVLGGLNFLVRANSTDAAATIVTLKHWDERTDPKLQAKARIAAANAKFGADPDATIFAANPPAVRGLGTQAGFEFQLQARGGADVRVLADEANKFLAELRKRPEINPKTVNIPLSVRLPQLYIDPAWDKMQAAGVQPSDLFSTLQAYLGALYVNDFNKFGRVYRVQLQAEPQFRLAPSNINSIYVRNRTGGMVPVSELVTVNWQAGPNIVSRFNGYTAVQVAGVPAAGYSTGQAMNAIQEVAAATLPAGFGYEYSGASLQEVRAGTRPRGRSGSGWSSCSWCWPPSTSGGRSRWPSCWRSHSGCSGRWRPSGWPGGTTTSTSRSGC